MHQHVGTRECFRFGGDFELDARAYELRSRGIPLKLKPIQMELLLLLLERRGQLVTREQIVERLWGVGVALDTDNSINGAISRIRQALRDDSDSPSFVQTVPSRGYRFIAPVEVINRDLEPSPVASSSIPAAPSPVDEPIPNLKEIASPDASRLPETSASGFASVAGEPRPHQRSLPRWPRRWKLIAALLAAAAIGIFLQWRAHLRQASRLTERDTIVVADFENNTGDPIFDETLKQALSVQLTQSPFLNVASELKVSDILKRMGRPANSQLSREVARDVCLRLGGKAILAGSISSLGSHYLVSLEALGCTTGDLLAASQMEAPNKEGVLKALDGAASQVRGKVGESMASLEKYDFPIDATTNSLEALKAFSLGSKALRESGEGEAIPFFRQAVQLDPDFALAYATLGRAYEDVGEDNSAAEDFTKAFQLRGRLSERERYYVTTLYNEIVIGDMEQAKTTGELWVRAYPHDGIAREKLGTIYGELGDLEKADAEFAEALRVDPDSTINVFNSVEVEAALNRVDQAGRVLDAALSRGVDGAPIHQAAYSVAFLRGDKAGMLREVQWAQAKPITEEGMLSQHSDTEAYFGRMRQADELSRRAVRASERDNAAESAALCKLSSALRNVEVGNTATAAAAVQEALVLAPNRNVKLMAALVLVRSGNGKLAAPIISGLEATYPSNTLIQFYWLPVLKGSIALEDRDAAGALAQLEKAAPYDRSQTSNLSNIANYYPVYVRGQAYLLADNPRAAVAEFQKIVANGGLTQNGILGSLAILQLARAETAMGDSANGRKHYGEFLALWKDADPSLPLLKDAKTEQARLN